MLRSGGISVTNSWNVAHIRTSRGTFEVFVAGHGSPLAITHGYSVFNRTGDYFAEQFVPHRTVYLVNLRGAGNSPQVSRLPDLSMATAVADLEAIRETLGFSQWDFAGHSTGGMLGLLYAVTRARSLSGLIMVGAAASHAYNRQSDCIYHPRHPAFRRMQSLIEALKNPDLSEAARARLSRARTQLSLHRPEFYDQYFPGHVTKHMAAARLDYFSQYDYPEFDLRDQLADVTIRTLVIGGRHDVQCPYWCSKEIGERVPGARLVEFTVSNHYPFLEEPDKFREVVTEFLHHP